MGLLGDPWCERLSFLLSLPHSHLAVHDVGLLKVGQQVAHVKEGLAVLLDDAVVARHVREERVAPQLLETLHLVFRELLQDVPLVCGLEVTWGESGEGGRRPFNTPFVFST